MALFKPWTNTAARASLFALVAILGTVVGGLLVWARSPQSREMNEPIEQPVQFDHRHHVNDVGIDCRYCHSTVEESPRAGIPSTQVCMGCHGQIWNKSPLLSPVREAYFADRPIAWRRVHKVPDFVYFNHSIHVKKGVGCETCHGRVDQMAAIEQVQPLSMGWCLDCHRNPEKYIRPVDAVLDMGYTPPAGEDPVAFGQKLVEINQVHTRTSCSTCHR